MPLDPKVKAVVFDMDRTLLDTVVNFRKLIQIVMEEFSAGGVPQEIIDRDAEVISTKNCEEWMKSNLETEQISAVNDRIEERCIAVEMETAELAKPFPGAKEFVERLISRGYGIAILTRGSRGYVGRCLDICGMKNLFKIIIDRDSTPPEDRKPSPKSMQMVSEALNIPCSGILYIGDEPVDYQTAVSSGAMFIGVETGPLDHDKWRMLAGGGVTTYPSIKELAEDLMPVRLGLGIDTGGTYTDAVITDMDTGKVVSRSKSPTTRDNLVIGIHESLAHLDRDLLGKVSLTSLSSTLATNSVVEGKGCRAGLICIGKRYDLFPHPQCYAEIDGSFSIRGKEEVPLDEASLKKELMMMDGRVDSLAISGYLSVRNPSHELQASRIAQEILGVPVVCTHTLTSKLGFIERTTTALMNARLIPVIQELLAAVRTVMGEFGIRAPLMIVKGDGSLMKDEDAAVRPVETILSGPASSMTGALALTGLREAVVVDMGGTTSDIGILRNGRPHVDGEGALIGGRRTRVSAVDVATFGIGGDSRIIVNGRSIHLTPVRAIPLCFAALKWPEIKQTVESLAGATDDRAAEDRPAESIVQDTEFFTLAHYNLKIPLTDIERKFLKLLSERPMRIRDAAEVLDVLPNMIPAARLESLGFITRIGFTPTDVLHAEGRFDEYDAETAKTAAGYLARRCRMDIESFLTTVHRMITDKITLCVMEKVILNDTDRDSLDETESSILSRCIKPASDDYNLVFVLRRPIIGIGAPVAAWLPEVAANLNTDLVVPSDSEMGNAIGAITGSVSETAEVYVRAVGVEIVAEPDCDVFTREGAVRFPTPGEALDFARKEAVERASDAAKRAGASKLVIETETDTKTFDSDGDEGFFRGATVRARATGKPDYGDD